MFCLKERDHEWEVEVVVKLSSQMISLGLFF